ncbi:ABC-type export system, membrane fusion protein [hydrothermal vent metagenome]|uniref:ABC-type export system, membrane fusion protein n=1 Tax=hydrothermal vent metagenome TaxID=652676 RepID=A0A1W1BQI0_9ZZZZ
MKSFFILILVSIMGVGIALGIMYYTESEEASKSVALPSMKLPYHSFIAGTGVIETRSKNIYVGSLVQGVVKKVAVKSGDTIKKGDLLFEIDDRAKKVQIPLQEEQIKVAQSKFDSAKHQLKLIENFKKVSPHMVTNEKHATVLNAFNEAKATLSLSKEKLKTLKEELKFYKIFSPIDGIVLQSLITKGSYFNTNSKALIVGSDKLSIRVNINEFDAWKFEPNSEAVAFVRGNPKQKIVLSYDYTTPLVVPKHNLTGLSTEATDTRVLQVIYSVKKIPNFPLYVGEMLDVFVKITKDK